MRFHWQNLNELLGSTFHQERLGSPIKHGRAWLWLKDKNIFHIEWFLGRIHRLFAAGVSWNGEDHDIQFNFSFLFITLYLAFSGFIPKKYKNYGHGKTLFDVYIYEKTLWWNIWKDNMSGWTRPKNKWEKIKDFITNGNFNPADFFLGRSKYSTETLSETNTLIPMPERSYPCTVKIFESTWKRPRWPFPTKMVRAKVNIEEGIPFPGKGENSWDCGTDKTYGLTCPETTIEGAISATVASVLKSRRRYGGSVNWREND